MCPPCIDRSAVAAYRCGMDVDRLLTEQMPTTAPARRNTMTGGSVVIGTTKAPSFLSGGAPRSTASLAG